MVYKILYERYFQTHALSLPLYRNNQIKYIRYERKCIMPNFNK